MAEEHMVAEWRAPEAETIGGLPPIGQPARRRERLEHAREWAAACEQARQPVCEITRRSGEAAGGGEVRPVPPLVPLSLLVRPVAAREARDRIRPILGKMGRGHPERPEIGV